MWLGVAALVALRATPEHITNITFSSDEWLHSVDDKPFCKYVVEDYMHVIILLDKRREELVCFKIERMANKIIDHKYFV